MEGSEVSDGHRRCADQAGLKILRSSAQRSPRATQLPGFISGCPALLEGIDADVADWSTLSMDCEPDVVLGPVAVWRVGGIPVIGLADSIGLCSGRMLTRHVIGALERVGLRASPELAQPE